MLDCAVQQYDTGEAADRCIAPGRHRDGCPGTEICTGCAPAPAAPDLLVCEHHADTTRDRLAELPELWAALGERPAGQPGGGGRRGDGEGPPLALGDAAVETRTIIRAVLTEWCATIGERVPDERTIALDTRAEVVRHQSDAEIALHAYRTLDRASRRQPHDRPPHLRTLSPTELAHRAAEQLAIASGHTARADLARGRRAAGTDTVDALRQVLDRHLARLLASEHADQLVHDVAALHRHARALAMPRRRGLRIACSCGARVTVDTARNAVMTCPGCGEWGTLTWWERREAPAAAGPLTIAELRRWLRTAHRLTVSERTLRDWRDRDLISPVDVAPGRGRAQRFDPHAVAAIAREHEGSTARRPA